MAEPPQVDVAIAGGGPVGCALALALSGSAVSFARIAGETDLLVNYTFNIAFRDSGTNFGLASAIATLLFIIVGFLAWINLRLSGRNVKI